MAKIVHRRKLPNGKLPYRMADYSAERRKLQNSELLYYLPKLKWYITELKTKFTTTSLILRYRGRQWELFEVLTESSRRRQSYCWSWKQDFWISPGRNPSTMLSVLLFPSKLAWYLLQNSWLYAGFFLGLVQWFSSPIHIEPTNLKAASQCCASGSGSGRNRNYLQVRIRISN